nr:hypothetical protein [Myxococcota bacterium]
ELGEGERGEVVLTIPAPAIAREAPREAIVATPSSSEPSADSAPAAGGDDGVAIALGIAGALAIGGAITVAAVVLTSPQTPPPVVGNAMPGVLTW